MDYEEEPEYTLESLFRKALLRSFFLLKASKNHTKMLTVTLVVLRA